MKPTLTLLLADVSMLLCAGVPSGEADAEPGS
jgi:hypothetical protein